MCQCNGISIQKTLAVAGFVFMKFNYSEKAKRCD